MRVTPKKSAVGLIAAVCAVSITAVSSSPLAAQQFPTDDPVIRSIWKEGTDRSRVYPLAQTLTDSLGPRLTGTPGSEAAAAWTMEMYGRWGIDAHVEDYGTWQGWQRGITHVDLVEPRVRSLNAIALAWSPGTEGVVSGEAVVLPAVSSPAELETFLGTVEGKFVLLSAGQPTCRTQESWEEHATAESLQRMAELQVATRLEWAERIEATGMGARELAKTLEEAGAAGMLTTRWTGGWGTHRVFGSWTEQVPTVGLDCEDYGTVFRLAENRQGPVLEVEIEAEDLGQVEVGNVIATIPGTELPDEYVLLSAHFDSWDGASGATDNGTGTITMMEAMRILKAVLPRPKRTIMVGHWNGEEQGLNGSRAFAADHPEIVEGLQALFNQDNGTGRVVRISMHGFTDAATFFGDWFSAIPSAITGDIDLTIPGRPFGGGSDYASFVCAGAPAFNLGSLGWDYGPYTWHTNRDTFDKIVMDDLRNNAVLTAMLAYLASEDDRRIPRSRRVLPVDPRTGEQREWPTCRDADRSGR